MKRNIKFCPHCLESSRVVDSRPDKDGEVVRIRECPKCRKRWVTCEVFDERTGYWTNLDYYFKEDDF